MPHFWNCLTLTVMYICYIGPLPSNLRKVHKKPILMIRKVFSNLFHFWFFRRFSYCKSINIHRFFGLPVTWWGEIFVLYESLDPWLPGRALEKICNCTVLGGKMFSIQAGFIYFNIRNHKSLIILKYISANSIYEEKFFWQIMVSDFEINETCLNWKHFST